jgi:hypothetical protein
VHAAEPRLGRGFLLLAYSEGVVRARKVTGATSIATAIAACASRHSRGSACPLCGGRGEQHGFSIRSGSTLA